MKNPRLSVQSAKSVYKRNALHDVKFLLDQFRVRGIKFSHLIQKGGTPQMKSVSVVVSHVLYAPPVREESA